MKSSTDPGHQDKAPPMEAWGVEGWVRDDKQWFQLHPEKSHRVRQIHPAEADSLRERGELKMLPDGAESLLAGRDSWTVMLVIQVRPGFRVRSPIVITSWAPLTHVLAEDGQVVDIDNYISALRRAIDVAERGAA